MRQTLRQKPSIRQKKAVKEEMKKPIKSKIPHAQATKRGADFGKICKRHFLYKIKFDKPTIDARMNMWHEMILSSGKKTCGPWLQSVTSVAARYSILSGTTL